MDTFPLERKVFLQAGVAYAQRIQKEMEDKGEELDILKGKIQVLVDEAKEAGVMLDDESAKKNAKAAHIRTQMDPLVKELNKQATYFAEHVQRSHRIRALADEASRLKIDTVQVPLGDALPLAGVDNIFNIT